ncbi:MAG: glycerol-3-phosphate dehydrogenase [Cyclobacteriaceae bacterium]|jgi:glycerol-3-phosphate dehydrogenase
MAKQFSIFSRDQDLDQIKSHTFDLTVVGGGITGAGIALDAASRGLNVLLLEKADFASGTSNKSTKLIHGGLRYLKQFEFGLVKETGQERAIVHRLAPHLAIPEKMLLPFVTGGTYGSISTSVGLKVYDFLADVLKKDRRIMLNKVKTLAAEPLLNKEIVEGGGVYSEYRTDDARLTIEVLKTAHNYEATLLNYAEVSSFTYSNGIVNGVVFEDKISGKEITTKSKTVIVAAGPWLDTVLGKHELDIKKKLRLTKGVHLVVSHDKFPIKQPVYFDTPDERMIFAIPRGRTTYIGTTDTEYTGHLDRVVATQDDLTYLLGALKRVFPKVELSVKDVESNWAGLRPLIDEEGKKPSELSRKDEVYEMEDGLIAIAGGKLTGYRKMAQRVVDLALTRLDLPHKIPCRTSLIPLTSDPFTNYTMVEKAISHYSDLAQKQGLDPDWGWHLITTYGSNAAIIWRNFTESENDEDASLLTSELWYCVNYEMVASAADFLVRRSSRLYFDINGLIKYREHVVDYLSLHFRWSKKRIKEENTAIDLYLKDATTYYQSENQDS